MTSCLASKVTLLLVLGFALPAGVRADIFDPANCVIPAFVDLVACDDSGALPPNPIYRATVVMRDLANNPMPGVTISASFCPDVKLNATIPGGTVECPKFTSSTVTDATGSATLEFSGAGFNTTGTTYGTNGTNCVTWYADGIAIGQSHVTTYDEDGASSAAKRGVAGGDLLAWVADRVNLPYVYRPRSDYNHNLAVDGPDLVAWIMYKIALPSYTSSCGTLCP